MSERQRLSVAILTKNEEGRIARCLESVRWADELIVVDGLSTDRTVEIARRFGAQVISHAFEGSFAAERNLGLQHATGEWVLHLDADDVVTPEFRALVERLLAGSPSHAAFKFRRKSYLLGRFMRFGGWYHYLPNLVRREAVRYEGAVHERPVVEGTIGRLDADVEHHPCEDLRAFLDRHNRYTTLAAGELLAAHGRLRDAKIRRRLLRKPWKTFWKTYVKKQGFREGLHGLVFSLFFAGVELIKWAKYWELTRPETGDQRPETSGSNRSEVEGVGASRAHRRETLSVGLMTKNEEARLAGCLDRVAGWADEIVIIDDESTDGTVEVARRYTDKVFVHP
ncbi:MAG: glycosyltransferase, partial [Candidatus Omnitrophica bacterium]|nr:glycosyltransferase [Candidatus Omnitrophota bacterium]